MLWVRRRESYSNNCVTSQLFIKKMIKIYMLPLFPYYVPRWQFIQFFGSYFNVAEMLNEKYHVRDVRDLMGCHSMVTPEVGPLRESDEAMVDGGL